MQRELLVAIEQIDQETQNLHTTTGEMGRFVGQIAAASQTMREALMTVLAQPNPTPTLATMGHDLRGHLNVIIGFAVSLTMYPEDDMSAADVAALQRIHSDGQTLLALVNVVVNYAKVKTEALSTTAMETYSIVDLLQNELLRYATTPDAAPVHLTVEDGIPLIAGKMWRMREGLETLFFAVHTFQVAVHVHIRQAVDAIVVLLELTPLESVVDHVSQCLSADWVGSEDTPIWQYALHTAQRLFADADATLTVAEHDKQMCFTLFVSTTASIL